MADESSTVPEHVRIHQEQVSRWLDARKAPMPRPSIPKIAPDETVMMPMRDGIRLFTELFFPSEGAGPFPTILIRTPYPDSLFPFSARPIELFRGAGYAVATQSCRGTWKSEGRFRFFQNEPEDGYDCVEWLAAQTWSDGKVGMFGSSYSGSAQWLAARLRPPHLTCIAPQSPGAMFFYETPYLGGVLFKQHLLAWPKLVAGTSWAEIDADEAAVEDPGSPYFGILQRSPNLVALTDWFGVESPLAEAMAEPLEHSTLDAWWERIMMTPESVRAIDIPVFAITGFHDGDQAGCLYNWDLVEANETTASDQRHLLVGPWRHEQMRSGKTAPMGAVRFGSAGDVDLPRLILRFFDGYMKGSTEDREQLPKRCRLYTSGSDAWHELTQYPPAESVTTPLYLSSGGRANSGFGDGALSFSAPNGDEPPDILPVDWRVPVPPVGIGEDARANETRHDVLVYTSPPLAAPLTILGPVSANLYVAADAPDCDVVLRIEDVRADGTAVNMTGEVGLAAFRARYREGFDREVLLTPNEPALLSFHVCHMGHTFEAGHRLRVAITATAADVLEPNHHTGEPVATAVARRRAIERIFHDLVRPSHLVLPAFHGLPAQN